jgi:hypothetical protein
LNKPHECPGATLLALPIRWGSLSIPH